MEKEVPTTHARVSSHTDDHPQTYYPQTKPILIHKLTAPIDQDLETESKYDGNHMHSARGRVQTINTQLRKTTLIQSKTLLIPYNKKNCVSIFFYYMKSCIVRNPRIYSFYLLYCSIWPRLLVVVDMYTDFIVAKDLYESTSMPIEKHIENINTKESAVLFMLACVFIIFPFMMVWISSLRFVQKFLKDNYQKKEHSKYNVAIVNVFLILYLFPPAGCLIMATLEIYWVIHDITRGIYYFVGGKILIVNKDPQITAIKQFRKVIEFFGESLPQLLLQSYIFINGSNYVDTTSLAISLFISVFSFAYNLSKLRRESKIHGMSVAEYALSLLQLSEIPIIKLVPRLPAIQKGLTDSANFASFNVDKESLGPIIDALSDTNCKLKTLKLSIDSLSDLNSKSIKMFGSFLQNKKIKIVISQISDPQLLLTLFTRLDKLNCGYLTFDDFQQLLSPTFYDLKIQTKIFQNLALRRLKDRDRVYFHDFYESLCGYRSKLTQYDFSVIQYPLHFIFKYISRLYHKVCNPSINSASKDILIDFDIGRYALALSGSEPYLYSNWDPLFDKLQNLFWFAIGLGFDVQYDETNYYVHNHIFFTIADALEIIQNIRCETAINENEIERKRMEYVQNVGKLIQCFVWNLTWELLKETGAVMLMNELNRNDEHILYYCIEHRQWALFADLLQCGFMQELLTESDLEKKNIFSTTEIDLPEIFYYACSENLDKTVKYLTDKYSLQQLEANTITRHNNTQTERNPVIPVADIAYALFTSYVFECRTPSLSLMQMLLIVLETQYNETKLMENIMIGENNLILLAIDWRTEIKHDKPKQVQRVLRKIKSWCIMKTLTTDESVVNTMMQEEISKYRHCLLDIIEYLTKENNLLCIDSLSCDAPIGYAVEQKDNEALMVMLKNIQHQNMNEIINYQHTKYIRFGSKTLLDLSINNELYKATAYLIRNYMDMIDFDRYNEDVEHPIFLILRKYEQYLTDESLRETIDVEYKFEEKVQQLYEVVKHLASYEPVIGYFGPHTSDKTLQRVYNIVMNLALFTEKSLDQRWSISMEHYEKLLVALESRLPEIHASEHRFLNRPDSGNPFYLVGFA